MVFGPRGRGFGKVGEVGGHFGVWEGKAKGVMRAPYGWVKPGESCLGDSLAIKYGSAERWAVQKSREYQKFDSSRHNHSNELGD